MRHRENDTNLTIQAVDGNFKVIDTFSLSSDDSLYFEVQVSGDILCYDEVEIAIYSENNLPLNSLGKEVISRVYKFQLLKSDDLVPMIVCLPGSDSSFADASFFNEGESEDNIHLDFQLTLAYWKENRADLKEDRLLCRISGTNGRGHDEEYMRDLPLLRLTM